MLPQSMRQLGHTGAGSVRGLENYINPDLGSRRNNLAQKALDFNNKNVVWVLKKIVFAKIGTLSI